MAGATYAWSRDANHIADDGSSVGSSMPKFHTRCCSIAIKDAEDLARPWLSWLMAAKPNSRMGVRRPSADVTKFATGHSQRVHMSLQSSSRAMHTFASIDVLDLDNPAAPAAYSVDGVDAKAATTNKPRHHDLTHRIFIHCCARQGACGFDWTSFSFAPRDARARVTILGRRCDRLVTVAEFTSRTLSAESARDESKQGKWPSTVRLHLSSVVGQTSCADRRAHRRIP